MAGFKREVSFGLDNFRQAKVLSEKDSVAQLIINILMMRPGNMPSLPHIGVNIGKYMYALEDKIDTEGLKRDIFNQCSQVITFLSIGEVNAWVTDYEGRSILMIVIPLSGFQEEENLIVGVHQDESLQTMFSYQFATAS